MDFVDDMFKYLTQQLLYSCVFHGIETHMSKVHDDGVMQDMLGNVVFSLKPPSTKFPPGRPRKKKTYRVPVSR